MGHDSLNSTEFTAVVVLLSSDHTHTHTHADPSGWHLSGRPGTDVLIGYPGAINVFFRL